MSANEFEKQVQQQLDRFQLTPSASVWQKVEEEIREKKRRRVVFFILLPVALMLLGFSIYQFLYTGKKTENTKSSVAANTNNLPANNNVTATPAEVPGKTVATPAAPKQEAPVENGLSSTTPANDTESGNVPETITINKKQAVVKTGAELSITNGSVGKTDKAITIKKNKVPVTNQKKSQDNSLVVITEIPSVQKNTEIVNTPVIQTDGKDKIADPVTPADTKIGIATGDNKDIAIVKKDSVKAEDITAPESNKEAIAKKKKSSSKIKWGVDFSTGLTFNNENTLSFARAEAFDMNYMNPGNVTGVGTSAPSNPPAVIIPPSPVNSGLSFRLGIVAEKQISKRSSISAGLQYAYSSNRIKVGEVTDTAVMIFQSNNLNNASQNRVDVDKLYSGSQQNNFTNRYHFIQLPINYHWQVNKSTRLPIRLNANAALGYLFSSNALVYDGALGGIYYKDKSAYNKMHFSLGAGLSFGWHTKNGSEWTIGPDLSFDMSRLVKNDNQYLMFGGIKTKILFPKKKNK